MISMSQRWLSWMVAILLLAGVCTVVLVFLLQGDGPPDYVTAIGERGQEPGKFDSPAGVAVDSGGNLFVLDTNNSRIQRLDPDGKLIKMWGDPGSDAGRCFSGPLRVLISPEDILWVADTDNNRLQSFDSTGRFLSEVGSLGQSPGQFSRPIGMAFDPAGNMWVADSGNNRVQKFAPGMKNVLAIIPDNPRPSSLAGEFNTPWGVACDATGTVYVADTENHRIQRFAKDGTPIGSFGTMGNGNDQFYKPTDIMIDRAGALFIVDSGNNRIKKHDAQGTYITEWGKIGSLAREFNNPQQITQGPDGTIYIADTNNNRVQKYRPRKSPLFQQDQNVQIPVKPRAPGETTGPVTGMPDVPSDDPTPGATSKPKTPTSPTPKPVTTPEAEPTRF